MAVVAALESHRSILLIVHGFSVVVIMGMLRWWWWWSAFVSLVFEVVGDGEESDEGAVRNVLVATSGVLAARVAGVLVVVGQHRTPDSMGSVQSRAAVVVVVVMMMVVVAMSSAVDDQQDGGVQVANVTIHQRQRWWSNELVAHVASSVRRRRTVSLVVAWWVVARLAIAGRWWSV